MKIVATLFATSALTLANLGAYAEILDFNDLTYTFDGVSQHREVNPIVAGSYVVQGPSSIVASDLFVWHSASPMQADPGFAAVAVNNAFTPVSLVRSDGLAFNFNAIDLGSIANGTASNTIRFSFSKLGSAVVEVATVTTDALPGLETFSFAQTGVVQVQWQTIGGTDGYQQFDDINVTPVPEASQWALLVTGLGVVGLALRRRK